MHIGMTDDIYSPPNNKLFLFNDFMTFTIEILCITKIQKIRDATFYNHGFYCDFTKEAIKEARSGKYAGTIDTSSMEAFIKSCE